MRQNTHLMSYMDVNHSIKFYWEFLATFDRVTKIVSTDGAVGHKRPKLQLLRVGSYCLQWEGGKQALVIINVNNTTGKWGWRWKFRCGMNSALPGMRIKRVRTDGWKYRDCVSIKRNIVTRIWQVGLESDPIPPFRQDPPAPIVIYRNPAGRKKICKYTAVLFECKYLQLRTSVRAVIKKTKTFPPLTSKMRKRIDFWTFSACHPSRWPVILSAASGSSDDYLPDDVEMNGKEANEWYAFSCCSSAQCDNEYMSAHGSATWWIVTKPPTNFRCKCSKWRRRKQERNGRVDMNFLME